MKKNVLNSPRLLELKKHRRRVFFTKTLLSLFALTIIFAGLVYISRIPALNIREIEVKGNETVNGEAIKVIIQKETKENYFWFFPKTNMLYYPKNNIKKELSTEIKKIKDINLSIKDSKVLEVSVTERQAEYLWCGATPLELSNEGKPSCYFVDDDGYIFAEAPYFSENVYFKFYGSADIGIYFTKENFKQLIYFKNTLTEMGLKSTSLYIESTGDIKVFLSNLNQTTNQPYITFKNNVNFQKLSENLEAALNTEPLKSNLKNKFSSLLYIDLRFGNKVYYKFQ